MRTPIEFPESHSSPHAISLWGAFRGPSCVGDDPLNNSS